MVLAGVEVCLNTNVDMTLVEQSSPDAVIIATGATPFQSDAKIDVDTHVVEAWQVLKGEASPGNSVVIADWRCDWIGVGLAEKLAQEGCRVRLAVDGTHAGQNLQIYLRDTWAGKLNALEVEIIPYARLFGTDRNTVYFHHTANGDPIVCEDIDTLVLSQGHQSVTALEDRLKGSGVEMHMVGDCLSPRTAEEAIYEGLMIAREI